VGREGGLRVGIRCPMNRQVAHYTGRLHHPCLPTRAETPPSGADCGCRQAGARVTLYSRPGNHL